MSAPLNLTPEQMAPELVGVGAQAIKEDAKRLGLTWSLRPATVQSYDGTSGHALIIYDGGDTVSLDAVSLMGTVRNGQRVMGMVVPPSGNFVIGGLGLEFPTMGVSGYASSNVNTGSIAAETVTLTVVTNQPLYVGRCYEAQILGSYVANAVVPVVNTQGILKVRKDTIAGTVLLDQRTAVLPPLGFNIAEYNSGQFQVSSTGTKTLVLTMASNTATGIIIVGNATTLRWLRILDVGKIDDYANIISI